MYISALQNYYMVLLGVQSKCEAGSPKFLKACGRWQCGPRLNAKNRYGSLVIFFAKLRWNALI